MTPADRKAMFSAWREMHKGVRPEYMPSVTHTAEKMFSAALSHAREQAAAQLEASAEEESLFGYAGCDAAAEVLREQAAKIRSGK